jgi:hypothetical protein
MSEEEIKHLMQSHYNLHEKYDQLKQENQQLKERINKAIEFIEKFNCGGFYGDIYGRDIETLLQILDKVKE